MMAMFDPKNPRDRRFDGFGPSQLPNGLDDEVGAFVAGLHAGGPRLVAEVSSTITGHGRDVLRAYAERMASLAVRKSDRDVLLNAVIANVVGGLSTNEHESLMVMAPIEDAAARLGVDLPGLFEDA
jgi:hypothetical protein